MKDQHTLVAGYRDFKQETLDMINRIKGVGNCQVKPLIDAVSAFHVAELDRFLEELPKQNLGYGGMPSDFTVVALGGSSDFEVKHEEFNSSLSADQKRLIDEGQRCRMQAEEHFRLAFMMLIRSVARPTTEY